MKLFSLFLLTLVQQCFAQSDGEIEIVLSDTGLNYAAKVAVDLLAKNLLTGKIPDFSYFKNIRVTEFVKPEPLVKINPGVGLTLSLNGVAVKAEANWSYQKKVLFFTIRDSGSLTATTKASISMSVSIGSSNGIPSIKAYSCVTSLSEFDAKVGGSIASSLYNLLISMFKGSIKNQLENKICEEALKVINTNGAKELESLKLQSSINNYLVIDYSLTKAPLFSTSFFKSYHKGKFVRDNIIDQTPSMTTPTDKMIGFSISENVFNSALRVLYGAGVIKYNYSFNDWGDVAEIFPFFESTDSGPYEVKVYASALPVTKIMANGISVNLPGVVELLSKPTGRTPKTLLKILFTLSATATASISSNVLKGYVSSTNLNVIGSTPSLPNVDNSLINTSIMSFVNLILPMMNEKLDQGMPLPTVQGVSLIQGSLVLNNRYLSASSNVRYLS